MPSSDIENKYLDSVDTAQDLEKKLAHVTVTDEKAIIDDDHSRISKSTENPSDAGSAITTAGSSLKSKLVQLLDLSELKGIQPITEDEKTDTSLYSAATMWLSTNMVVPSFAVGVLGVTVYGLNFATCVLIIFFFGLLGALPVAYFAVFGPVLGLRQMIMSRYMVGNITARVFATINCIACVGWGAVNSISSVQLLTMINVPHNCPPWAGCVIIILGSLFITFFGYNIIHYYEKWSWIPNLAVYLVIIARVAKKGTFTNGPWESGSTTAGNVLSFGSVVLGCSLGWVSYIADYTVYMPAKTNKIALFTSILIGVLAPLLFTLILGAATAAASVNTPEWNDMYNSKGTGGMIYAILVQDSLHGFGEFCCIVLALCTIAINIPTMYSIALGTQSVWAPLAKVPRPIWTTIGTGITLAIAIPAYYKFTDFLNNFMGAISYYLSIYVCIALSEHFIWRKGKITSYNVADWDNWSKLPIGVAGCCALFVGAIGVALGMNQTYWIGEIGRKIGKDGGDIGFELGVSLAFITFVAIRPLELKRFGR